MQNTARVQIDLTALRDNLKTVRKLCPGSRIMAMVKADAYGHGLVRVARALEEADGLAVARLVEARALRRSGITQRILLLGTLLEAADLDACAELQIDVTAHDQVSLESVVSQAYRRPLCVWLKLDSGMHRIGFTPDEFVRADRCLSNHPGILELIHMTHFSSAEDASGNVINRQLACFWACHNAASKASISLANSAALIARPDTHGDWVRPGIMLYGENPLGSRNNVGLRTAMRVTTRVVAIRAVGIGESVGYNGIWVAARETRVGTLGIGYGDGYPRHARNGTPVWINGHLVPLIGRVSMDSITVDLTDHPGITVGDDALLWGKELPVAVVSNCAGTNSHQLFTSLSQRVDREYYT